MKEVLAVFLSWFLAQAYKVARKFVQENKLNFGLFLANGGTPSAHAATVTALSVSVYLSEGFSWLFVACVVFSLIVINDSLNVRWQTGVQASLLAQLIRHKRKTKGLSKSVGHTLSEVIIGVALGAVVTLLVRML